MGSPSALVLGFISGAFFLFSVLLVNLPQRISNHDAVLQEIISHHQNNLERRKYSNSGFESESPDALQTQEEMDEGSQDTGGAQIQFLKTRDQARGPKNVIASLNMTVGEDGEEKSEYHIVSAPSEQKNADTEDERSGLVSDETSATQTLQNQLPKFDPTPTSGLLSFKNLLNYGNTGSSSVASANVLATTAVPLLLQTHQQRVQNARKAAHTFFGLGVFFAFWCYFRSRYDTINSEHELILKKNTEAKKRERARRKEEKKKKESDSNVKKAEGLGGDRAAAGTVEADGAISP